MRVRIRRFLFMESLRDFNDVHIDDQGGGWGGEYENELFFNCRFDKVRGLTLKNCDLNRSTFDVKRIEDALGFTLTLDCHSFRNVEYSELLFDLFLTLAAISRGNDAKREKLLDVIGRDRAAAIMRVIKDRE